MFNLEKNMFFENGVCNYADEHKNTAFMRRTEEGFVAKLRFADKNIKAEPLIVELFTEKVADGGYLQLHFSDESILEKEDVKKGRDNFISLVLYWIDMLREIKMLDLKDAFFMKGSPEDVANYKYSIISKYPELETVKNLVGL